MPGYLRKLAVVCVSALLACLAYSESSALAADGGDLVGTKAHDWHVEHWINSKPLSLAELRGSVVLVRWWTAPDCPFCAATASALNDFHERYAKQGLRVLGFYHHKSDSPLTVSDVEHYAKVFKFQFPIAIDPEWTTLRSWWLTQRRHFTSVSFLIDRHGVIRYVHPGGQYVKGDAQYAQLDTNIARLLSEPAD